MAAPSPAAKSWAENSCHPSRNKVCGTVVTPPTDEAGAFMNKIFGDPSVSKLPWPIWTAVVGAEVPTPKFPAVTSGPENPEEAVNCVPLKVVPAKVPPVKAGPENPVPA